MSIALDPEVLRTVRASVCAIGYITVPLDRFLADPRQPFFKVVGTGFLVREDIVATNRHVIQALLAAQADLGFDDAQRLLLFVVPGQDHTWTAAFVQIVQYGIVDNEDHDVGFCRFTKQPADQSQAIGPIALAAGVDVTIGEPIYLMGYPYGHSMLHKRGQVYRWGPVIQFGYVSALSPFDTAQRPTELLLDIRAAGGMSGAPVYSPIHGAVVGILHSGFEATTALALPLTQQTIDEWLIDFAK